MYRLILLFLAMCLFLPASTVFGAFEKPNLNSFHFGIIDVDNCVKVNFVNGYDLQYKIGSSDTYHIWGSGSFKAGLGSKHNDHLKLKEISDIIKFINLSLQEEVFGDGSDALLNMAILSRISIDNYISVEPSDAQELTTVTPIPGAALILGVGLLAMISFRSKRNKK